MKIFIIIFIFILFLFLFLDEIIKLNRGQRRKDLKKSYVPKVIDSKAKTGKKFNKNNRRSNNQMEISSNVNNNTNNSNIRSRVQKQQQRSESGNSKLIIRSNSGRARENFRNNKKTVRGSTPGLRQPWEKLPTAPLPDKPIKISIRNELAEKSMTSDSIPISGSGSSSGYRRNNHHSNNMMMDTDDYVMNSSSYHHQRPAASTVIYEPRDSLASREEYRIGNRFSTQGMAIDYQLPSGASYDTRPTRRY